MNYLKKVLLLFCIMPFTMMAQEQKQVGPVQQQPEAKKVTDSELTKFASVYAQVNQISQAAQQKMIKKVQGNGFQVQKFQELQKKKQQGQSLEISEEKKKKFNATTQALQEIQKNTQMKAVSTIKEGGLTLQRYQQIVGQLRQDQNLQKRLKSKMQPQKNAPTQER